MSTKILTSLAVGALLPLVGFAATIRVPQDHPTIQAAVDAAEEGDEIAVSWRLFGYSENVKITKNDLTIKKAGFLPVTVMGKSGEGSLGTFVLSSVSGVTLQGLNIVGIDNGLPGIENAAVYIQGNASDITITQGTITAMGDLAIASEYGGSVNNINITHNLITGKTFQGETPAGDGFSNQFTQPNVPRQAVTIGGPNTTNVTFAHNVVTVHTGGLNAEDKEQGNTVVTIHADGSTIAENTFSSFSNRSASQLRVRGSNAVIENNNFLSLLMGEQTSQVRLETTDGDLTTVYDANSFDNAAFADNEGKTIYKRLKSALEVSADDATVIFNGIEVEGVVIDHSIDLIGNGGTILGNLQGGDVAISVEASDVAIHGVNITAISSAAGTGIKLASGISNVTVTDSIILSSKYGVTNSLPGGNNDINLLSNSFVFTGEGNGNPVYLNGAASNGVDNEGIYISGNYFAGNVDAGVVVGIEGSGIQISGNDFANSSSDFSIIEIWNGDAEIDGNCFAASSGAIITGSGSASVNARYNYFGSETGPAEGNADGIPVVPYLLSCEASYIGAIPALGGTISPAFVYAPASEPATFTITPASGSVLEDVITYKWDGETDTMIDETSHGSTTSYTFPEPLETGTYFVTGQFKTNVSTITAIGDETNGSLSPSGTFVVANGGSKSFIATPNVGYVTVVNYEGNGSVTQASGGLITVSNITGAENELTVSFVEQGYDVSYVATGRYASSLTVTTDPLDTTNISASDTITFTIEFPAAAANAGVVVSHVLVNGVAQSTGALESGDEFVLSGVTQNTVVTFATARQ